MNGSVYKRLAKRDSHTGVVWKSSTTSVNHAPTTVAYRLKQGMVSKAPEPIRQHVELPSTPYLAAMKTAQPDSRVQKYH
jgi:hypothetical protein